MYLRSKEKHTENSKCIINMLWLERWFVCACLHNLRYDCMPLNLFGANESLSYSTASSNFLKLAVIIIFRVSFLMRNVVDNTRKQKNCRSSAGRERWFVCACLHNLRYDCMPLNLFGANESLSYSTASSNFLKLAVIIIFRVSFLMRNVVDNTRKQKNCRSSAGRELLKLRVTQTNTHLIELNIRKADG